MSTATLSPCTTYRYDLTRDWDETKPLVNFVMLNPSTADAEQDDPTVRRCIGFAKAWGYGRIAITNLFAYRSTEPKALVYAHHDPVGAENDRHLLRWAQESELVVCAWGANGYLLNRDLAVKVLLRATQLHCLRLTANGHPAHPLYLPKTLVPILWELAS